MATLPETSANDNDDLIGRITNALLKAVGVRESASFEARERLILEVSNEAVRSALERILNELAEEDEELVELGTESYRRHQPGKVKYHSLCGPLHVRRWTYRQTGVRNGPTIVPLELRAGIIESATPALAYAVAQGYAKAPVRSVRQDLVAARRAPPSRATLERMAKAIGTSAKKALMPLERSIRRSEELPANARGITLGMDRTSVPMEETVGEERPKRGKKRRVSVHYRMAYVGTVALTDRKGEVVKSWRYASAAHEGPHQVVCRMMNDLRRLIGLKPRLRIGLVQDGAPELWTLMRSALGAEPRVKTWHEAIDMYHLMERLSKALEVVEPDATTREKRMRSWKQLLLRNRGAIAAIARFFELDLPWQLGASRRRRQWISASGWRYLRSGWLIPAPASAPRPPPPTPQPRRWSDSQRKALRHILYTYLLDPSSFRYVELAKRGLHVGSGVTEGACKSLIAARAKRSGQRWREQGITAVLTLRSLVANDRFDAFWKRFMRQHAPLTLAA